MENEIMNNDEVMNTIGEEVVETCKGSGIIFPVLFGAFIVGAGFGLYKLGRKAWDKYKSKKALTIEPDNSTVVECDESKQLIQEKNKG